MEPRVGSGGPRQALLRQKIEIVPIDGGITDPARRIDIHDLNIFSGRSGFQSLPFDIVQTQIDAQRNERSP